MKCGCIAVFAKTPELSSVKTRLAEKVGPEKAQEIYKLCINSIQNTLQEFASLRPEWDISWALAEEGAPDNDFWKSRPFQKMWTGTGALGTRLHTVYSDLRLKYKRVILIGTDSP